MWEVCSLINIINLIDGIKDLFTPHGTIVDVSAFKLRNKNEIHLFGLKFLFKKFNEKFEIPSFLELDNELMAMTYKECNEHHPAKATKQNNIAKTAVKLPTSTELNIKKLFDDSEKKLTAKKNDSVLQKSDKIDCDFEDKTTKESTKSPNKITAKNVNSAFFKKSDIDILQKKLNTKIRAELPLNKKNAETNQKLSVFTYNICGIKSSKPEIDQILQYRQPSIVLIQEATNRLLIALKNNIGLQIFKLKVQQHWMSAKITEKTYDGNEINIIVINLNIPSSVIRKKQAILTPNKHINKLKSNFFYQKIIFIGDFNMDINQIKKCLAKSNTDMSITEVYNSSGSHYNGLKCGKGTYQTVEGLILDINSNIITFPDAKLNVWEKHFGDSADDTTGNSRNNTKWDSIFPNITQSYYERDNIITWEEVAIGLKATPNNKAAGIDTIPSEIWKLVQQEANSTTNFSKLIFKLINLLYNNNNIPEQW
ncbi:hypothetical protein BB561_003578 [Smittium simulii]|uniref:Endonuclease/exonuclease/phosphatase domain-containing protein n=1 Tax=Smittium simulii TaxID=133385 RepID=A0A2T9YKI2_9FUNG|nr:hypothetical protein BB561_003578 [Smittium simulii]